MAISFQVSGEDMVLYNVSETGDSVEDEKYFSSKGMNFLVSVQ